MTNANLTEILTKTWQQQADDGFLLSDPHTAEIGTTEVLDDTCGVRFRFRWMPHREIRGDVAELERRGILNPDRDESKLFRDPRDPKQRHCFLCPANIAECHPMERLVPLDLAGQKYFAGANFAWIELDHYTILAAEHTDQAYSRHGLEAMLELHTRTEGRFRVLFNGSGAGASIPWHLHYQITTSPMPIEQMPAEKAANYPTTVHVFNAARGGIDEAHGVIAAWIAKDPENHTINTLIAAAEGGHTRIFVFPRDARRATATNKGLVGGFEVAGDFVLSAPNERASFDDASVEIARSILSQVKPPA
jgi:hypothetical protein